MFESALLLIDKLIALIRTRDENNRQLFVQIIDPLFQEVQKAYEDYGRFVHEAKSVLGEPTTPNREQMARIMQRREEYRGLRAKIRTLASVYANTSKADSELQIFMIQAASLFTGPYDDMLPLELPPEQPALAQAQAATGLQPPAGGYETSGENPRKIGIIGPRESGKTYLFQSIVYRLQATQVASALSLSDRLSEQYRHTTLEWLDFHAKHSAHQWVAVCTSYASLKLKFLTPL